jgi:multiple sugar transport system substrate-binding protein
VTFCAGKDTSGGYTRAVERFNERYADQGLRADLLEFPEGSDAQRQQAVQRLEARSPECDVYAAELKRAIEQARPRSVSPVYTQISHAIYENVNKALSGELSPEHALAQGHEEIDRALATF